ncbi:MAG TPA: DUF1289 domain-containing protein [Burkholderiales bacterium]|nr:DUF1289 domain-containing protein [Burkholderiales bacterium]
MDLRPARSRAVIESGACARVEEEALKSPCIKVCEMDPARGLCLGCRRTLDEIARWGQMSDAERERVIAELPARSDVAKIPVPPFA